MQASQHLCGKYGRLLSFAVEEAVRPMAVTKLGAFRAMLAAYWHGVRTAGMKATTSRRIDEAGWLPSYVGVYFNCVGMRARASSPLNGITSGLPMAHSIGIRRRR